MKTMFKAFRQIDDETLKAVFAPTIYKVGKTKVFRKCPAFVVEDISLLSHMFYTPYLSVWEVAVDNKVEVPAFLLGIDELTSWKIRSFWNGKIPGRLGPTCFPAYLKIKPIRKVAELNYYELRLI